MDSIKIEPTAHNPLINAQVSCADALVQYFSILKIPYVFGVPGGNIDYLCGALARSETRDGPRWVLTRSEQGAGFMADGFARETGRLGVCCSTSGPGATNLITPVSNAYVDGIPMLVITAQTAMSTFGQGGMQEASGSGLDIMTMFSGCTRYNSFISHPEQLHRKLFAAIRHAYGACPGPAHLSIPSDILSSSIGLNDCYENLSELQIHQHPPERHSLEKLKVLLDQCKKGVIVLGAGSEEASTDIISFAESRNWPIITIPMARGLISHRHPLFRGVFGTAGHDTARLTLQKENADLILVIGAELDENATCGWDGSTLLSDRIVHINSNPEQLWRSHMAKLNILASPKMVFKELNRWERRNEKHTHRLPEQTHYLEEKPDKMGNVTVLHKYDLDKDFSGNDNQPVNPRSLFWMLSNQVPEDTRVYADAGNSFFWAIHYWRQHYQTKESKNKLMLSLSYAAMGWAIGAAIGNKCAAPDKPVVCLTGDGSYLMTSQEITVAKELNLNILMVVLNDGHLGAVKHGQRLRGAEDTANNLPQANFAQMGEALGVESYRIEHMSQFMELNIVELLNKPYPVLLDIVIDSEVAPPIGQRVKVLQNADIQELIQ